MGEVVIVMEYPVECCAIVSDKASVHGEVGQSGRQAGSARQRLAQPFTGACLLAGHSLSYLCKSEMSSCVGQYICSLC